jgi:RNA polymerase sigma-70 factor (ECF subfamily)
VEREAADNEIRARLAADDSSALEMIWDQYASDLLGFLVCLHCSRPDAEDSLQDVFVTIARKRKSIARARNLKAYLFRMARNLALNRIKRSRRNRERDRRYSANWLMYKTGSPEDGEDQAERTGEIATALAALPEKQRSVIVLKFFRDKNFREIAEILDISENTAASRFRYGMKKLRNLIEETP